MTNNFVKVNRANCPRAGGSKTAREAPAARLHNPGNLNKITRSARSLA